MKNTYSLLAVGSFLFFLVTAKVAVGQNESENKMKTKNPNVIRGISFGVVNGGSNAPIVASNPYSMKEIKVAGKIGFEFGSFLGFKFGKTLKWSARVAPMMAFYNTNLSYIQGANTSTIVKLETTSLAIPTTIQREFELGKKSALTLMSGLRWNYNFTSNQDKVYQNNEAGLATKSSFWTADFGIGFIKKLSKTNIGLEAHYNYGISNNLIQQSQHLYSQTISSLRPMLFSVNLIFQN